MYNDFYNYIMSLLQNRMNYQDPQTANTGSYPNNFATPNQQQSIPNAFQAPNPNPAPTNRFGTGYDFYPVGPYQSPAVMTGRQGQGSLFTQPINQQTQLSSGYSMPNAFNDYLSRLFY